MAIDAAWVGALIGAGSVFTAVAGLIINAWFRSRDDHHRERRDDAAAILTQAAVAASTACETHRRDEREAWQGELADVYQRLDKGGDIMVRLREDVASMRQAIEALQRSPIHNGGFSKLLAAVEALRQEVQR